MATTTKSQKDIIKELNENEVTALEELQTSYQSIRSEISKVIIGQEEAIEKNLHLHALTRTYF